MIYLVISWVFLFIFRQFEHRVNRHKRYIPPAVNPNPPI